MCVIYTVRAYMMCENDFSFVGGCWVDGIRVKGVFFPLFVWLKKEAWGGVEVHPHQDVLVVSSSLKNMQQSVFVTNSVYGL